MSTQITIKMMMPKNVHPMRRAKRLKERVQEAMDNIESGSAHTDSDWEVLRRANNALITEEKRNPAWSKLLDKIEAIMIKYGVYDACSMIDDKIDITKLKKVV